MVNRVKSFSEVEINTNNSLISIQIFINIVHNINKS